VIHPDTVLRIVGTLFDLTERKQVEAERTRTEVLTRLVFARERHDQFGEQLTACAGWRLRGRPLLPAEHSGRGRQR
jgi:hypothetical protein